MFVDDQVVARQEGVTRRLNPLTKDPRNPLLRPERPWEGVYTIPREILYDEHEGKYKMWYSCLEQRPDGVRRNRTAYATSVDGIIWERPVLGLVEFNGSKQNNIISEVFGEKVQDKNAVGSDGKPRPISQPFGNGPKIILDEHETDPARRFKALTYGRLEDGATGVCVGYSADGLNWSRYPRNPVLTGTGDTHWLFGWDETVNRYVAYIRPNQRFRTIGRSESADFQHWTSPVEALAPDDDDPPGIQFYGMPVFQDRGIYFGLICVFHPNSLRRDVQLAYSRDGVKWHRAGRRHPILTYGLPDEFDSHQLMALRPFVVGDEIRVYYLGEDGPHALTNPELMAHPTKRNIPKDQQVWLKSRQGYVGLAVSRQDRFVSLDAGAAAGEIVTKPFVWRGPGLELNADAARGEIRAEIVDAMGKPVGGLTFKESTPIKSDSLRHQVGWRRGADAAALSGKTVQLRLVMTNARLYSFTILP